MTTRKQYIYMFKVTLLCFAWYASSSLNNVVGKQVLMQFEYPMTLTLVQLISISVYSEPLLRLTAAKQRVAIPTPIYKKIIIPLAFGKFIASVSSHVSIWKVPVSYAHTVKATMPLFTVTLSRILFGETQTTQIYISLIPIILGVTTATLTELNFDIIGLLSALFATFGFSLQNIFSKKVLKTTGIHQFQLLATLARISLLLFLPFWLIFDGRALISRKTENVDVVIKLLILDGFLSFIQNILAFSVLKLVTPLTYAVANASKRIAIIVFSLIVLQNHVSFLNFCGITMAIFGVFCYTKAKHTEGKNNKTLLPIIANSNNNNINSIISDSKLNYSNI